ncbi:hypothetical protein TSUD_357320 [Trifolium subterraneum]|uniref:F-box domain-containing protein n=1 Tax=Trifolium subterraneum TaxID=3900 RepID=A0A2Z6MVZ2_TRISU|nr:hypothetical protein TSUD_357320 [Trifolium subterraneum]
MINMEDFPDEILRRILRFLPFKTAFRTTLLSKRWRPLPRSLAVLNINDQGINNANDWFRFRQFMDTMRNILHNEEINSYYKGFPVFGNLTDLKLYWLFKGIHDWDMVVKILQNCPKLQTLLIVKGIDLTTKEDWEYPFHVPECVSSHLTSCSIAGYQACEADFRFATYILQNAIFLQVMTIRHTFNPKPMESFQFLEDLHSCQRISPECKLNVSSSKFQVKCSNSNK